MNKTNLLTLTELSRQLCDDGYEPGTPECVSAEAAAIDREVCAEAQCDECGRLGLSYVAFHSDRSYRAVAWCPACKTAAEF